MSYPQDITQSSTDELVESGQDAAAQETAGSLRAAIANAMVGLLKSHYGRGPTAAKAWLLDDYVFVAMEGGLTRSEETLVAAGKEEEVRSYRLAFQGTMAETATRAISELTGREVLTYHSQIVFHPPRAFEIFVLGAPVE
jgi:uncharacterized protein YbcI